MNAKNITDESIARVRAANPIADVIRESGYELVEGREPGTLIGLCAQSVDADTQTGFSFSVNPTLGLWRCVHCDDTGDVFRWIEKCHGISFGEAVELLAARAGTHLDYVQADPWAAIFSDR